MADDEDHRVYYGATTWLSGKLFKFFVSLFFCGPHAAKAIRLARLSTLAAVVVRAKHRESSVYFTPKRTNDQMLSVVQRGSRLVDEPIWSDK